MGEASAVTINQNGNINPRDAQLSTCLACTSSLEVKATLADITFNITKGEFNTGFLSELADRLLGVDEGCASPGSQCQIPAQGFSDVWIEYLYGSFAKVLEGVAEYLGIIALYTPYEHTSPDPGNPLFAAGYINGIERITGGPDPALHHALVSVNEFQFGETQQVVRVVHILGGALGGQLAVLPEEGGKP